MFLVFVFRKYKTNKQTNKQTNTFDKDRLTKIKRNVFPKVNVRQGGSVARF